VRQILQSILHQALRDALVARHLPARVDEVPLPNGRAIGGGDQKKFHGHDVVIAFDREHIRVLLKDGPLPPIGKFLVVLISLILTEEG
jgi:hypothetical protein